MFAKQTDKVSSLFTHHSSLKHENPSPSVPLPRRGKKVSFAKQTDKNLLTYLPTNLLTFKKAAFTLAETLITLGIIGLVAAVTMPTLIANYQKQVTVNKLKKNYALFAQVFQMAERDNETAKNWDYSLSHTEFAEKYFLPYLPTAKKSKDKYKIMALGNKAFSLFGDRLSYPTGSKNGYMYSLPDGALFGTYIDSYQYYPLAVIVIDLNGTKGPNIAGKDVFYFDISRQTYKFEMFGQGKDRNTILAPVNEKK